MRISTFDRTQGGRSKDSREWTNLTRSSPKSGPWTLLDHPALNFKQEAEYHLAVFFRDLREFHANDRPTFPLHNWIDDRHAFLLQYQDGRANELALIEGVEVFRADEPGSPSPEFIDNRIDGDAVHAQQQID